MELAEGIVIRCMKCNAEQRVRFTPEVPRIMANNMLGLLSGDPDFYVYPPDEVSPIGKSACCKAQITGVVLP